MQRRLRRIRGAIGVGLTWAAAWFGAGMLLLLEAAPIAAQRVLEHTVADSSGIALSPVHFAEGDPEAGVDLAPIRRYVGGPGPLIAPPQQLQSVTRLTVANRSGRGARGLAPVIGTRCLGRPVAGRPVKEEQDAVDLVEFHEIQALATELLSADEIPPAGGECTATTGHVEAIVFREPQFIGEKGIRGLLEPAVRAGDNQNVRANGLPLTMARTSHCCSVPAPPNA